MTRAVLLWLLGMALVGLSLSVTSDLAQFVLAANADLLLALSLLMTVKRGPR